MLSLVVLASCGREVPLRIGPSGLVTDLAVLEVRVWRAGACPATAMDAASVDDFGDVAVVRYYTSLNDATSVGVVPSGAHAVSVIARDAGCNVVAFGCTPNLDFGSASSADVSWSAVTPSFACPPTYDCDGAGSCFQPRQDAGH